MKLNNLSTTQAARPTALRFEAILLKIPHSGLSTSQLPRCRLQRPSLLRWPSLPHPIWTKETGASCAAPVA